MKILIELKKLINWKIFIGISVFLLIIAEVLYLLTPKTITPPVTVFTQTNFDNSKTSFQNVTFTGEKPTFPTTLSIANIQQGTQLEEAVVQQFITHYNLKVLDPTENDIWVSSSNSKISLSKDSSTHRYVFLDNIEGRELSQSPAPLDTDVLLEEAKKYMKDLFPTANLEADQSSIAYQDATTHLDEATKETANTIKVFFDYKIDNFPLFFEHSSQHPFQVYIHKDFGVFRIDFYPFVINFKKIGDVSRIPIEKAVQNINQNKASIVSIKAGTFKYSLNEVKDVKLTEVTLEYRSDSSSQLIYPFYRFNGTAITNGDKEVEIEVITPAIETLDTGIH